ncbi:hypothetical protein HUG17_7470 [Dermatophagoides farinae]|uniref:G-protein coupled receptors family 1 profile domain-containing protein n=1 Tax=Dermatophagoides farinae TaxID=6954 RepID=A0A9D4NS74_DERFA|nr:hypothetical protein HUG17_7470 [Dermatophagoides farinae]
MLHTDLIHHTDDGYDDYYDDNITATTTTSLTSSLLKNTNALLQSSDNQHNQQQQQYLWITYGWLAICIVTIIVIVLIIWTTLIHYTYRKKWRTLDILLAAILIQELPNAITLLSISTIKSTLIHLPRSSSFVNSSHQHDYHSNWNVYDILLWLSTSQRFFQFAIITSLIVDRAFIIKWPYQYRFSVRHSQIRFYMIILALISAVFGTFAVISHQNYQFDRSKLSMATTTTTTTAKSYDFDRSWPTPTTTTTTKTVTVTTETTTIIDDNSTTESSLNGTISIVTKPPPPMNQTSYYDDSMIQFTTFLLPFILC